MQIAGIYQLTVDNKQGFHTYTVQTVQFVLYIFQWQNSGGLLRPSTMVWLVTSGFDSKSVLLHWLIFPMQCCNKDAPIKQRHVL